MNERVRRTTNGLLLQAGAVGAILLDARGVWVSAGVVYGLWGVQLLASADRRRDLLWMAAGALVGFIAEWVSVRVGWVRFTGPRTWGGVPPWVPATWGLFAVSNFYALHIVRGRVIAAAAVGALFGGLGLWGAGRVGALAVHGHAAFVWTTVVLALAFAGLAMGAAQDPSVISKSKR